MTTLKYRSLLSPAMLLAGLAIALCLCPTTFADETAASSGSDAEGFVSLFDGESIDGWIKRGGEARYRVEEGAIVGTSVMDTPNTFLCTPREYGDFILEVELKVDDQLNSGIQIRSLHYDEPVVAEGEYPDGRPFEREVPAGVVHGYQVEIDPSSRAYSGGIYDEARRGWLDDLSGDEKQAARDAFRNGEWNHYRIEARGPSIKTFVNGVPAANLTDDMTASGFIGLQVHSIGSDENLANREVRWRNLRIKELD